MRHWKKVLLGLLVLTLLLLGANFYGRLQGAKVKEPEITSELIGKRLEEAKELTSVKYIYTNTGAFTNSKEINGWTIPFTTKKFILSYDGSIHAGVDLSEMQVTIADKVIHIKLPEAKILAHEIDEHSLKVLDEESSVWNPSSVNDYTAFTKKEKSHIEDEAIDKGLLKEANEKAQKAVKSLLDMDSTIRENYQIQFD